MKRLNPKFYTAALVINIFLITAVFFYGYTHPVASWRAEAKSVPPEDVYYLDERTAAEFQPVILEKFNEESELVVYTVEASEKVDLEQAGLLNFSIMSKQQNLVYRGSGSFYVDLRSLDQRNIRLGKNTNTVIIEIPHTRLAPIEINPEQFEAGETHRGLLAFGELKFTPQEYNQLETEARSRIRAALDTEANFRAADARAVEEMQKIFNPLVRLIDSSYSVEIVFIGA